MLREASLLILGGCLLAPLRTAADEGGTSFWLPGQFGSFAAVAGEPGWTLPIMYYHASVDAGAARTFRIGGRIAAGLDVQMDLVTVAPTYVFSSAVLGARATVGIAGTAGRVEVDVSATMIGPSGGTLTGEQSDVREGVGDLLPTASLIWTQGHHNFMLYAMGGVPVGDYSAHRLANLGINHWALDVGGGYSYLDSDKGREFSAVLGFTENWENPDTDYENGASAHLDWAASQFLSEQLHVGVSGYVYRQVSGDSGAGAVLGDFKSQVSAIGPQVGYFFPVGGQTWYVNLKGYFEFDAKHRPEGSNIWLTLAIPLSTDDE